MPSNLIKFLICPLCGCGETAESGTACTNSCLYVADGGGWTLVNDPCNTGCVCLTPSASTTFDGQFAACPCSGNPCVYEDSPPP